MTGWELLYLAGAVFMAISWLLYGIMAGNTDTAKEKVWLLSTAGLTAIFWPLLVVLVVIAATLDSD